MCVHFKEFYPLRVNQLQCLCSGLSAEILSTLFACIISPLRIVGSILASALGSQ